MKKVLLADDESAPSEIIRYFIRKNRLPLEIVGEAQDGEETMKMIYKHKPDIVFLDIEMPGMNGLQVMEKIRREYAGTVDFIIITAYDSFTYAQQALRMGARDFLLKPVMYEQFCETMKRVVGYKYSDNPAFNELLEYIDLHYAGEISLADCGALLSMSESNVARFFKKYLDTSFTIYLNEVRMRYARQFLKEGLSIKEAADKAGYNNLNYFYRIFKNRYSMTPREYVENGFHDQTEA